MENAMTNHEFMTLVWMILGGFATMAGGFGWMIMWLKSISKNIHEIDKRLTVVETILQMAGTPIHFMRKGE